MSATHTIQRRAYRSTSADATALLVFPFSNYFLMNAFLCPFPFLNIFFRPLTFVVIMSNLTLQLKLGNTE